MLQQQIQPFSKRIRSDWLVSRAELRQGVDPREREFSDEIAGANVHVPRVAIDDRFRERRRDTPGSVAQRVGNPGEPRCRRT